jgi:hypothetical protein
MAAPEAAPLGAGGRMLAAARTCVATRGDGSALARESFLDGGRVELVAGRQQRVHPPGIVAQADDDATIPTMDLTLTAPPGPTVDELEELIAVALDRDEALADERRRALLQRGRLRLEEQLARAMAT